MMQCQRNTKKWDQMFSLDPCNCVFVKATQGSSGLRTHVCSRSFCTPTQSLSSSTVVLGLYGTIAFEPQAYVHRRDKEAMPPLEPAFENLLRSANLHEDVISALRKEGSLDREMFVSLDSTEDGLAASAKDASVSTRTPVWHTRKNLPN